MTSWFPLPGYGIYPNDMTSHNRIPNDQISVLDVKIPSRKASGGIHFTGSIAFPPFLNKTFSLSLTSVILYYFI